MRQVASRDCRHRSKPKEKRHSALNEFISAGVPVMPVFLPRTTGANVQGLLRQVLSVAECCKSSHKRFARKARDAWSSIKDSSVSSSISAGDW